MKTLQVKSDFNDRPLQIHKNAQYIDERPRTVVIARSSIKRVQQACTYAIYFYFYFFHFTLVYFSAPNVCMSVCVTARVRYREWLLWFDNQTKKIVYNVLNAFFVFQNRFYFSCLFFCLKQK